MTHSALNQTATHQAAKNYPARVFRDLVTSWHQDAAADRVDVLAAELASCVAPAKDSLCLGLIQKEAVSRLYGLVFLLDGYGLLLRQRYREQGDGVFVFLERKKACASEFARAVVTERVTERVTDRVVEPVTEPDYVLPRAA